MPVSQPAKIIPLKKELESAKYVQSDKPSKISIPTSNGMLIINIQDISYCAADSNYTRVFYGDSKELLVSKPLGSFEQALPSDCFVRIHQSYMVNTEQVLSIHSDYVLLYGDMKVPMSRRRRETLRQEVVRKTISIQ